MPAVLTHDIFGRDIYDTLYKTVGESKNEFDSFLLGCQGPDVMFFAHLNPAQISSRNVGTEMHRADPIKLMMAFLRSIQKLPTESYDIGRSYFLGLICHYILDSRMHPFIYAQQYEISDAGVNGLNRSHGHEIHAEIESELDILVLSTKLEKTIADHHPEQNTLHASKKVAQIISYVYKHAAAQDPINREISKNAFQSGLSGYRLTLGMIYSPYGVKRSAFGAVERMFRDHSFVQAMSHKNRLLFESDFDNRKHRQWIDPWTDQTKTDSFWDIYNSSLSEAKAIISSIDLNDLKSCESMFEDLTCGLDFNGAPTRALLLEVEDL